MQKNLKKILILLNLITLPSCGFEGIFFRNEKKTKNIQIAESTDQKIENEDAVKKKVIRSPERILRRLTLDLFSRLPSEAELLELDQNNLISNSSTLIDAFFEQKIKIAQSLGARHAEIFGLNIEQNIHPINEQFLQTNQNKSQSNKSKSNKLKILSELNLFFENILLKKSNWLEVLSSYSTKIPAEISEFYNVEVIEKDLINKTIYGQYQDQRPELGILALNAIYYHLISHKEEAKVERGRELAQILDCEQTRLDEMHTFHEFDKPKELSELIKHSQSNKRCAACHKIYSEYSDMSAGFSFDLKGQFEGITFKASNSKGRFKGSDYQTVQEKQKAFQSHAKINICYLQRIIGTFFQQDFDSSVNKSDELIQHLSIWREQAIQELFKKMFKTELYLQTAISYEKDDHTVRFMTAAHFWGIAKDFLPSDVEISNYADLEFGIQEQWQANSYLPSFFYMKAVQGFVEEFSDALIQYELTNKSQRNSNLFKIWKSNPDVKKRDVVDKQISQIWWRLVGEKLENSQKSELMDIFYQASATKTTSESWKYVLIAVMMSAEFLTY
ncbi:MAG: hypothetical protein KBD78_15900 [Oligoflexales bacterium]|nr:hypothetical protein [Oligoflexales bacterium]